MSTKLSIRTHGFSMTDALAQRVKRRFGALLSGGADRLRQIVVRLRDENGPKGGVDKRCGVEVRLATGGSMFVEDADANLYVAIDRAARRTKRTLRERIRRARDRRRSPRARV